MPKLIILKGVHMRFLMLFLLLPIEAFAVKGYYRKDGTYVQPHSRSNPNSTKTDNYGSSSGTSSTFSSAYERDKDKDGVPNFKDKDDDNDGLNDDEDN